MPLSLKSRSHLYKHVILNPFRFLFSKISALSKLPQSNTVKSK